MIATNIEQSKHLLELGLGPKTADMFYFSYGMFRPMKLHVGKILEDVVTGKRQWAIPAWSLSALLDVMPISIDDYDLYITKHKYVDGGFGYNVEYNRGFTISVLHKETNRDLVAAAYKMACWLLEQGLIKKGGKQ